MKNEAISLFFKRCKSAAMMIRKMSPGRAFRWAWNNLGFTLLEMVVVIIIIGVLAGLGLPKLFKTIEMARGAEAFANINSVRQAIERCALLNNGGYDSCSSWTALNITDPGNSPNAHFDYFVFIDGQNYSIEAQRNTRDGGHKFVLQYLSFVDTAYAAAFGPSFSCSAGVVVLQKCSDDIFTCGTGPFESFGRCSSLPLCISVACY